MLLPARPTSKKLRAAWFVSVSGTATAGASVASRFATDRSTRYPHRFRKPGLAAGFFFLGSASAPVHRAQHRLARPAIDLQPGLLLIGTKRRAGLHPGLAVELVLVETDSRQLLLHRLDVGGAQLPRGRPRRHER